MIRKSDRHPVNYWWHLWLLLSVMLITYAVKAEETPIMEKAKLQELLTDRKTRFNDYFNSIEKKSGIFGNRTKRDLTESNSILTEIVKTDNQIISVLNRAIDFKNFEKTGYNYDKLQTEQQMAELKKVNDALEKKTNEYTTGLKSSARQLIWWKWLCFVFGSSLLAQHLYYRKRFRAINS